MLPQQHCTIFTATRQRLTIWTERHAMGALLMRLEGSELFPRVYIPQTDSLIPTATCQCPTLRTERHAIDLRCMLCERVALLTRGHIPQTNSSGIPTAIATRQRLTIRTEYHVINKHVIDTILMRSEGVEMFTCIHTFIVIRRTY